MAENPENREVPLDEQELLFNELNDIAENLELEISIRQAMEQSMVELKNGLFSPIYDEYYGSHVVGQFVTPKAKTGPCWEGYEQIGMKKGKGGKMVPNCVPIEKKSALKNSKGGLTAAGRAHFKKTEGANLKPGVKGPADTPEKMRRKGSFLARFFTNPSGPMVDKKGRATRLALSATAWGERVPKNAEDAAKLAAKGRRLLEKYAKSQKKKSESITDFEYKSALGTSIGQRAGGAAPAGSNPDEGVDKDSDGMIFDGTPQEQRAPYKKQSNTAYEKARRKFVRSELARQGIKRNAKVQDRSKAERDARARARGKYDLQTRAAGEEKQNEIDRAKKKTPATSNPKPADRYPNPSSDRSRKPADRYPDPPNADRGRKPADRYPNPSSDRSRKPADRYPNPTKKYPPGQKPSPKKPKAINMPYPVTWERGEA